MIDFKVEDHLTAEEREIVKMVRVSLNGDDLIAFAKKLAECRAVMKENEFPDCGSGIGQCLECDAYEDDPEPRHTSNCAWAACLAGVGEKEIEK